MIFRAATETENKTIIVGAFHERKVLNFTLKGRPHIGAGGLILYMVKIFRKSPCYSLRELRRTGVKVTGREVFISRDSTVSRGVTVNSPCYIAGATTVEEGCTLLPGCNIFGSHIARDCTLGPYCNVRAGCKIGPSCRIGDFVELKNSRLGEGCRAAHLSYVGDAELGGHVNVGCGVVFANYDGKIKARTYVGDNAFIGCNSVIIAPAHIGAGAYVAAGTVFSGDVPPKSLALSRPPLKIKPEGACGKYLNDR